MARDVYADPEERAGADSQPLQRERRIRGAEVVWKRKDGQRILVR